MAKQKKQYKVLQPFEMGEKKFDVGQEVELDPDKTKAMLENGAIELLDSKDTKTSVSKNENKETDGPSSELVKQLMQEMKEIRAINDMLLQTADKKLLSQYYAKNQKKLPKEFRLNTINDKVIVLVHDMPVNNVGKNPATKQWFEEQMVEMVLEDESILKMTYQNYVTAYKQVTAKLVGTQIDEMTEEIICKLIRLDNAKEYNINLRYLN